jgi:delta 1-pyrroline-5-carboxylate dehydrogenase
MTVMAFDTEEEAVALANDTAYGLSSSVWTADLDRAERVARALEAGNVCINDVMVTEGNSALPFGGVKNSGIGRYKGRVGLHSFCNIKSVMVDKGTKNSEANWYPYTEEKYRLLERVIDTAFERRADAFLKLALTGLKLDSLSRRQTL